MTIEKFEAIQQKIFKQFGKQCETENIIDWEKQKELLSTLLIRNKLLRTENVAEFWRAAGSTCDFLDEVNRPVDVREWKWQTDVAFCILYMDLCMKKWPQRRKKKSND